jgi:diamine N-acetyltransferase
MNEQITLQEITEDTLKSILDLKVAKDQERFVAPNAVSIAQAHFSPRSLVPGDLCR